MSTETKYMITVLLLLFGFVISLVFSIRIVEYYELREMKVKTFCIEKQSAYDFCHGFFQ